MLFWPLALIALVALIVVQLDATLPLLNDRAAANGLLLLSILLTAIIVWGLGRNRLRVAPAFAAGAGWVVAFGALGAAYAYRDEARAMMDVIRGEATPSFAVARGTGVAEIPRSWDGHFRAVTEINGEKVGLLIDTGASFVLLTYDDAMTVGLTAEDLDFRMPVTTANGRAHVAPVRLESVRVNDVAVYDVEAAVAEPGKLHSSLLGMSFLRRVSEAAFRPDTLVLRN